MLSITYEPNHSRYLWSRGLRVYDVVIIEGQGQWFVTMIYNIVYCLRFATDAGIIGS